jgi:cytochrome c biogenesis protein CcmG, thiol:disulfide interchange protein DsbE
MKALLMLITSCLAAQASVLDLTHGTWINEDQQNGGVTQIVVRLDGSHVVGHAWGACRPTDCDWGEAEVELWNGIPLIIWKQGFSTTRMQLVPQPDGRLLVVYHEEFQDDSGRSLTAQAQFFSRQQPHQDSPEETAARKLMKLTAETYRGLPAARFDSTEIVNIRTGKREARTERMQTLFFSQPNRLRIEAHGSGEETVLIEDGTTEWEIFPQSNEYSHVPEAEDISWRIGYTKLDKVRGTPRITGHQPFEGASCTVIQMDLERGVKQELWIDDATHVVRKDLRDQPAPASGAPSRKSETVYTLSRIGGKMDPNLFTYDPAKTKAQSRRRLSQEAPISLVGKPAPDFALTDLENREVRLGDLRGKVVLLDFWATWCAYCREALPTIELLHRAGREKGLEVFGVDAEPPELAREYLTKFGYTLPSLVDSHDSLSARYHVEGWPTIVLIDREGYVAYYGEGEPEKIRDMLQKLGAW